MIEFDVQDMSCAHCVVAITKAVQARDPQAVVQIDLATKRVRIESALPRETLAQALDEAGYAASAVG